MHSLFLVLTCSCVLIIKVCGLRRSLRVDVVLNKYVLICHEVELYVDFENRHAGFIMGIASAERPR